MNPSTAAFRLHGLLSDREADIERLAFVATVIFAGVTFWFAPRLPITDLPQHAAQVAVWHDLLLGTSKWQPLLYVNYLTPYMTGYSLALLLSFIMPVSTALKLVLALAYYSFVAACVALRKRLGGDRRMDWLFIPGFFGFAYVLGFYTFLVAAPIGVLFVLLAYRFADRPTPALGVVLFLADLVLFFSHGLVFLFANCIGGILLLQRRPQLTRLLPAMLPYVAIGLWCMFYALVHLRFEGVSSTGLPGVSWGWDPSRLYFLIFSIGLPFGHAQAGNIFALLVVLMLAAPLLLGARLNWCAPEAFVPLGVTLLVWALVPTAVPAAGTWFIYQRFALFLLPFYGLIFRAPDSTPRCVLCRLWLPLLCWVALAIHAERLLAFTKESAAFDDVLAATQPGHRALGVIFNSASAAAGSDGAYLHFPLWYQAEKGGFVDFNFAGFQQQVVRYRPDRVPPVFGTSAWAWNPGRGIDWTQDQASIYRYFFVRREVPLPPGYFPAGRCEPVLLKSVGAWSVFENVNCHTALGAVASGDSGAAR